MLGVFLFLSFYFAVKEQWIQYILFFTLALYTKESAIVLLPVIIGLLTYNRIVDRNYKVVKNTLYSIIPFLLVSLHFVYQKSIFDWYFYPLHMEFIELNFEDVAYKFSRYYRAIFDARLQYFFNATLLIYVCLILYFQNVKRKKIVIGSIVLSFILLVGLNGISNSVIATGSLLFLTLGIGFYKIKFESKYLHKLVLGSWLFMYGFTLFSALNFYSTRYIVPVIIFYAFVYMIVLHKFINLKERPLYKYLIVIFLVMLAGRFHKKELSDIDTSYKHVVKTHNEIVNYFVGNVNQDKTIGADFLETHFLTNANCSYLNSNQEYSNVSHLYDKSLDYYIITNLEASIEDKRRSIDLSNYKIVANFSSSLCIGEVYQRK